MNSLDRAVSAAGEEGAALVELADDEPFQRDPPPDDLGHRDALGGGHFSYHVSGLIGQVQRQLLLAGDRVAVVLDPARRLIGERGIVHELLLSRWGCTIRVSD